MEIESSNINIERFNDALNKVIYIHPMLRTIFLPDGTQKILQKVPKYSIDCKDIRGYSDELKKKEILRMRDELAHKCNDETKWPLFNISALKLSDKDITIFTGFDMLITDSTSWQKVGEDLSKLYYHPEKSIEKSNFTFRDYILAYEKVKFTKEYEDDKKYWLSKIDSIYKAPNLPLKTLPENITKPNFDRLTTKFDKKEWAKLKQLAREHSVTPSVLFCTIYSMVLSYWSNQNKLCINITVFNRIPFNEQVENLVGDFTSLVLLNIDNSKEKSFWDKVKLVQDAMTESLEHKLFDGIEVIRELIKTSGDINSIAMPVVFTSTLSGDSKQLSGWSSFGKIYTTLCQTPQVYLDNQIIEMNGELVICLDYVKNLFDNNDIRNMYDKYIEVVKKLINDEEIEGIQPVKADINFINNYNCTDEEISGTTLQKLFKNQVLKTPKNIALKFKNQTITYEELDKKSDCVAKYSKKQGVERKDFIAVKGERCIETIVNILGILKLGAAYVPLDPNYSEERTEYIVKNSKYKFIISPLLFEKVDLETYENGEFKLYNDPNDTAYIIYTSGSTGKPKGVVISHKAVTNTIIDINNKFNVGEKDRLIAISSLRLVMLSGDWIPLELKEKIVDKFSCAEIVSLGGATEASIWSIYYPIKQVESSFINHPTLGRIYKTGDFGVLRREGYIEFLGRKDSQVKIRGNRVELGEIEYCLRTMKGINNAVVVDFVDGKRNKYLCAYIVSDEELKIKKIKKYLLKHLADYMVPLQYVKIDRIPLSANGKVDRKSLPKPRNDTETKLEEICKSLLDVNANISIDDDLYELGWDSIKIISCASKIKAIFGIDMPFTALLKYYTIRQLGEVINGDDKENTNIYTILNDNLHNKIFAFPPALTFGIAFNNLSKLIDNYSIYAFDYVEDDNIINMYVDEIIKIQDKGIYNLMGYSG